MSGHRHNPTAGTQNQGNTLGDRSCVRQSRLYRVHESGNGMKSILGQANLCWNPDEKEGAYKGHSVYDHMSDNYSKQESVDPRYLSQDLKRRGQRQEPIEDIDYRQDFGQGSSKYSNSYNNGQGSRKFDNAVKEPKRIAGLDESKADAYRRMRQEYDENNYPHENKMSLMQHTKMRQQRGGDDDSYFRNSSMMQHQSTRGNSDNDRSTRPW